MSTGSEELEAELEALQSFLLEGEGEELKVDHQEEGEIAISITIRIQGLPQDLVLRGLGGDVDLQVRIQLAIVKNRDKALKPKILLILSPNVSLVQVQHLPALHLSTWLPVNYPVTEPRWHAVFPSPSCSCL